MGLFTVDLFSTLTVTHLIYKTALIITVVRWILCWAFRVRNRTILFSSSSSTNINGNDHNLLDAENPLFSSSSSSAQMVSNSLLLTTFREITERLPKGGCWDTCAVCLSQLKMEDEVRELKNCCHVFHRECIDTWLDDDNDHHHDDNHNSCPICRAPLVTPFQSQSLSSCTRSQQPSWAVERLLYLFGDDLLL